MSDPTHYLIEELDDWPDNFPSAVRETPSQEWKMTAVNEIGCQCGNDTFAVGLSPEPDCGKQIIALRCIGCNDLIYVEGGEIVINELRARQ